MDLLIIRTDGFGNLSIYDALAETELSSVFVDSDEDADHFTAMHQLLRDAEQSQSM